MPNLLDRYGIKDRGKKRMSISFIDDVADCSYKTFLKYFAGVPIDMEGNVPTTFGSGCHRGLARINKSIQEDRAVCKGCSKECKVDTLAKVDAMKVPLEECKVQQIMLEEFKKEFDEEFCNAVLEKHIRLDKRTEGQALIDKMHRVAPKCMNSAMFERQPVGEILVVEDFMSGTLGEFDFCGVIDLVLGLKDGVLILDYKTAGKKPNVKDFPLRQLALYIHMLKSKGLPVNGVAALHMLKTEPPKKPRKGAAPHQQTYLSFFSLDRNQGLYNHVLEGIHEDMKMASDIVSEGRFMRNRKSMFCPCDMSEYCFNTKKLEKFLSNKKKE